MLSNILDVWNNFLYLIILYLKFAFFFPNKKDRERGKKLVDSTLKLSRIDLEILVGDFLMDIVEY